MTGKNIWDFKPEKGKWVDARGLPITICPCGSRVWNVKTIFDNDTGEIALLFTTMECILCGTIADLPDSALPKE